MAELEVKGGNSVATELAKKSKAPTITLAFGPDDQSLYDEIVGDAKNDRRSVSQFLLLWISNNYNISDSATK